METAIQKNYSQAVAKARGEIKEFLKKALGKNYDESAIEITYPPKIDLGDFSVPCFEIAKNIGQSPSEIAKSLAEQFQIEYGVLRNGRVSARAKNFGPYLNFYIDIKKYASGTLGEILSRGENFGNSKVGLGKRVMIEYSGPNTHKEFHIGHLRNACLGSAIVNLYRALGYKVIAANYIGDVGSHVAKCLWALTKLHQEDPIPANRGKYLGAIYVEANARCEESEECRKEASEILQKLESGDRRLTKLWKETRQWCLDEFKRIYKRLGAEFDVYFFESEVEAEGKKMARQLLEKGIAEKSEGAVVIDLEKYGLKKFLILKSDGTSLYATKDLALAIKKFNKYKISKSIYITDSRQSFYFQQLFKALELIGFYKPMAHIPYELVTVKEGAMSSRQGTVVLFEDFENEVLQRTLKETEKRHPDWGARELEAVSRQIAYAAMKYTMLSDTNSSIITFDLERSLKLTGNTGPYLQYVHARISSILKKVGKLPKKTPPFTDLNTRPEQELVLALSKFPETIEKAALDFEPAHLASYLYRLAQIFSLFYEEVPVLKSEETVKKERLLLVLAVKTVMARGLELLGIEAPAKM